MTPAEDGDVAREAEVLAQAQAWLLRLRSGDMSPAEVQGFRHWSAEHPEMAHRLRDTWSTLRTAAADIAAEEAASGEAWTGETGRGRALSAFRPGRRAFAGFAIAAGASWLALRPPLALWPSVMDLAADYRTATGEQRQLALSGHVVVTMNTQTRVDVLSAQAAQQGIHLLEGEAEITAGVPSATHAGPPGPVLVVAGRGRMQADVARFDVRRTGEQVCVTCVSGSIAFEHPLRRLTLGAAQQLIYDDRSVQQVYAVDPTQATAWRRGVLVFNRMPVAQVVDEINRYRPGKVILRNAELGRNRVQAQFPVAKLDDVIDMLGKLYGARVTRLPGGIVLLT
jgi:transmembrane sensor